MHDAAGRSLYRNVHIGGRAGASLALFFRGALIGTGLGDEDKELAKCPLSDGKECTIHDCKPLEPQESPDSASLESAFEQANSSPAATSQTPMTLDAQAPLETPPKTKTQKRNQRRRVKEKRDKKVTPSTSNSSDPPEDEPPVTNFKLDLLEHVRVLTISTHHACDCHLYGPYARVFLPNLQIVRVASDFLRTFELLPVCDARTCKLLSNVKCHKLVLRNLDGNGLPLEEHFGQHGEPFPICKELVVFLPMDGRRLTTDFDNMNRWHYRMLQGLGLCFPNAPDLKFVFYPTWEGWDQSDDAFAFIHGHAPVTPDDIVYSMTSFLQYEGPQCTIYGMGKLRWAADGDIAATFKHHFPHTALTQRAILDMVRHELRTSSLYLAISPLPDEEFVYDPGYPEHNTYKTFNEYLNDKNARRGEITAYD
jgi:hypothetical protein